MAAQPFLDPMGRGMEHPDFDPFDDGPGRLQVKPTEQHGFRQFDAPEGDTNPEEIRRRLIEEGDPERTGNVAQLERKKNDHSGVTAATMSYIKREFEKSGFMWIKVEYQAVTYGGMAYKRDLMGFADAIAIKNGCIYAVQVTTLKDAGNHLRSMLHPSTEKKHSGPVRQNVDAWRAHGGRIVVCGCFKEGRNWAHKLVEVTDEVIAGYDARRR